VSRGGEGDRVGVGGGGGVSESGTHAELMNHNGLYRKLNDMQFDFGVVTQSPVVEGVSATTPLEEEE